MKKQVLLRDETDGSVLYSGLARIESLPHGGIAAEMETQDGLMIWKILKKGIIIESTAQVQTILQLMEKGTGKARILTPYGEMESALSHVVIEKTGQSVRAAYQMPGADSFAFCLEGVPIEDCPARKESE